MTVAACVVVVVVVTIPILVKVWNIADDVGFITAEFRAGSHPLYIKASTIMDLAASDAVVSSLNNTALILSNNKDANVTHLVNTAEDLAHNINDAASGIIEQGALQIIIPIARQAAHSFETKVISLSQTTSPARAAPAVPQQPQQKQNPPP